MHLIALPTALWKGMWQRRTDIWFSLFGLRKLNFWVSWKKDSYLLRVLLDSTQKTKKYALLVSPVSDQTMTGTKGKYFKAKSNNIWCHKWKETNSSFLSLPKLQPATQIYHHLPCPFLRPTFTYSKIKNLHNFKFKKMSVAGSPLYLFLQYRFSKMIKTHSSSQILWVMEKENQSCLLKKEKKEVILSSIENRLSKLFNA